MHSHNTRTHTTHEREIVREGRASPKREERKGEERKKKKERKREGEDERIGEEEGRRRRKKEREEVRAMNHSAMGENFSHEPPLPFSPNPCVSNLRSYTLGVLQVIQGA